MNNKFRTYDRVRVKDEITFSQFLRFIFPDNTVNSKNLKLETLKKERHELYYVFAEKRVLTVNSVKEEVAHGHLVYYMYSMKNSVFIFNEKMLQIAN